MILCTTAYMYFFLYIIIHITAAIILRTFKKYMILRMYMYAAMKINTILKFYIKSVFVSNSFRDLNNLEVAFIKYSYFCATSVDNSTIIVFDEDRAEMIFSLRSILSL